MLVRPARPLFVTILNAICFWGALPSAMAYAGVLPSMAIGRVGHALTTLANGKILIAGGAYGNLGGETLAEVFDPAKNKVEEIAGGLVYLRSNHTQTLLPSGDVLLAGGASDYELATNECEIFCICAQCFCEGPANERGASWARGSNAR